MGGIISFLQVLIPLAIKYGPQISALISAGSDVFAAIKKAAPVAAPIIKEITAQVFPSAVGNPEAWTKARELTAKAIFAPHTMTPEEEQRWFDRQSQIPAN